MKKHIVCFIAALTIISIRSGFAQQGETITINVKNIRHSYYRNENLNFDIDIVNNSSITKSNIAVKAVIIPLKSVFTKMSLPSGKSQELKYHLRCSDLKPGKYELSIILNDGVSDISQKFNVNISEPPNSQRLSVLYWSGGSNMMELGMKYGFNSVSTGKFRQPLPLSEESSTTQRYRELFDKAVQLRANIGVYIYTVDSKEYKDHPEVYGVHRSVSGKKIDNQDDSKLCLREPYIYEVSEEVTHSIMKILGTYPSFNQALINSEFSSSPCFSERCRAIMKEETGLDLYEYDVDPLHPPKTEAEAKEASLPEKLVKAVPVNGVIADDNPYYRYYMWWWKRGMGDTLLNERLSDIIHDYNSDVITWHDPFRLAPVYGRHRGLDCIGQWTYTHPDPKYTAYIETLITGAKPEQQMVMPDMTTHEYQNWLAPTDSGTVFIPEHILRENCWIALSRRPDIICHYIASEKYMAHNPKTYEMMTWMSENVYKPYGPFILEMERIPRKAAILCSAASMLFPEINRGFWPNKAMYPFYSLLMMAHMPTDVIFDETITRYGLDQYDILFLHQCETLPRSVYDSVLAFKKRGGIVLGDMLLRADIPLDYRYKINLDHRNRQLADLILKGEGVTADEDREIMSQYAAELRGVLDGKVERYVDSESPEVVFNVLRHGPVRYIFMVNDRRTYGDRFGQWKTFHARGVPQTVTATVNPGVDNPVFYDIREHRRIPVEKSDGRFRFSSSLDACDGTIVAVYPFPLDNVSIECPSVMKRGEPGNIRVTILDSQGNSYGTQPIHLRVTDPNGVDKDYTDYYATSEGRFSVDIIPACNDMTGVWKISARDLTSDLEAHRSFEVW